MFGKILFFILLIVVLFALWSKRKREINDRKKVTERQSKKMIQCPICGVHFAEVDGEWSNGVSYCSKACLEKAKKNAGTSN